MIKLVLLFFIIGKEMFACYQVQKCCPQDQVLSMDLKTCISNVNKTFIKSVPVLSEFKFHVVPIYNDSFDNFIVPLREIFVRDRVSFTKNGSLSVYFGSEANLSSILYPRGSFCVDQLLSNRYSIDDENNVVNYYFFVSHPCSFHPCKKMCCPRDILWSKNKCQIPPDANSTVIFKIDDNDVDIDCDAHIVNAQFSLLPDGNAETEDNSRNNFINYCAFYTRGRDNLETEFMHCPRKSKRLEDMLYILYYTVGLFFLIVTLLVYILVQELRKTMFSWIMMSHIGCMFICYSSLTTVKILNLPKPSVLCSFAAYLTQFSFIAAMLWLNVMCIYISRSFSIASTGNFNTHISRLRIYFYYSVYVWIVTTGVSCLTFFIDNTSFINHYLKPKMGITACWLSDGYGKFLFFYLPVSLILVTNLILFMYCMKKILQAQKESKTIINQDSKKHKGNKPVGATSRHVYKIVLCAKLCALMGITWIFEILSWAINGSDYYWYFSDAVNSFRGVFIFLICCCKKKVFKLLFKKYFQFKAESGTNVVTENHRRFSKSATKSTELNTTYMLVSVKNGGRSE